MMDSAAAGRGHQPSTDTVRCPKLQRATRGVSTQFLHDRDDGSSDGKWKDKQISPTGKGVSPSKSSEAEYTQIYTSWGVLTIGMVSVHRRFKRDTGENIQQR